MGCNTRDKSLRGHRKARHQRQHHHPATPATVDDANNPTKPTTSTSTSLPNPLADPTNPANPYLGLYDEAMASAAAGTGGYCTEEQLEELLLKNLDFVYKEALTKLSALGYDDGVALRAVLRNGHCYGTMDVLSNILHNAVAYINSSAANSDDSDDEEGSPSESSPGFSDLRHLQEYSLAGMVCLLQEVRPHLTRGDAMWCLLMSDLHVGRASTIDIPVLPPPPPPPQSSAPSSPDGGGGECSCSVPYSVCRFHRGCSGEKSGCVKRFELSKSMRIFLKRNTTSTAPGARPNLKLSLPAPRVKPDIPASLCSSTELQNQQYHNGEDVVGKDSDVVASVLKGLESMTLEEEETAKDGVEDHRKEMILSLIQQIRELEGQVKDRKEWAQRKAMQAAQKLCSDLTELKMLRMEKEESQRLKKGKTTLEDTTMKRLSEMENALRKASGQVDRANAAVRQLEAENAEIRAEMEASKLSAAESVTSCLEAAKREKKCLKRLLAWEKQKEKLQEEIAEERKKIVQMQEKLNQEKQAQKEAEAKWKEEVKAKEQAIVQVEEERRAKEAADANTKRKLEALRQRLDIAFQRHEDDLRRLEEELSRLTSSSGSTQSNNLSSNILSSGDRNGTKVLKESNGKVSRGLQKLQESSQKQVNRGRQCLMCVKGEVSVVFLPCAHQVVCANCSEDHAKRAISCPCCGVQIEERIRVYGASS